jgi:ssDNA-binding Zn-finger/Zn-ribbon topoisomerase 1
MTHRCTNNTGCKHIAAFLNLDAPPQTPASGELIKKLMLMGWVGGKDDLHPGELLKPAHNTSSKPEPYEEPDPKLDQAIPETVYYECPNCGQNVDIDSDKLADWILNHLYVCEGGKEPAPKATPEPNTPSEKVDAVAPYMASSIHESDEHEEPLLPSKPPTTPSPANVPSNLAAALCNMQKVDLLAVTDSDNPFHNAKYADLASVWAAIRKPLTDNGLAVIQTTEQYPQGITVVTTLVHISGETFTSRLSCEVPKSKPDKNGQIKPNVQGLGSTITYLRRYSLAAMVGVAPIDDDGEAVMSR